MRRAKLLFMEPGRDLDVSYSLVCFVLPAQSPTAWVLFFNSEEELTRLSYAVNQAGKTFADLAVRGHHTKNFDPTKDAAPSHVRESVSNLLTKEFPKTERWEVLGLV